jgi:hypothetical protein
VEPQLPKLLEETLGTMGSSLHVRSAARHMATPSAVQAVGLSICVSDPITHPLRHAVASVQETLVKGMIYLALATAVIRWTQKRIS